MEAPSASPTIPAAGAACATAKKPGAGSRVVFRCPVSLYSQLTPVCFLLFSLSSGGKGNIKQSEQYNAEQNPAYQPWHQLKQTANIPCCCTEPCFDTLALVFWLSCTLLLSLATTRPGLFHMTPCCPRFTRLSFRGEIQLKAESFGYAVARFSGIYTKQLDCHRHY